MSDNHEKADEMCNINAVVFDVEIAKPIPSKDEGERLPDLEYCEGWGDHAGMGIACVCAYDYVRDQYRVFGASDGAEFLDLLRMRPVHVTFNGIGFDSKVIGAAWGERPDDHYAYDLFVEAKAAAKRVTHRREKASMSLGSFASLHFGTGKSGDGAMAPINWQRGEHARVIDYCLEDVRLTKLLFDRVLREGNLQDPQSPLNVLPMRSPREMVQ